MVNTINVLVQIIFYRGDTLSGMWKALGLVGLGMVSGAVVYSKLQNSECMMDMKTSLDNMTKKTSNRVKNMME